MPRRWNSDKGWYEQRCIYCGRWIQEALIENCSMRGPKYCVGCGLGADIGTKPALRNTIDHWKKLQEAENIIKGTLEWYPNASLRTLAKYTGVSHETCRKLRNRVQYSQ